MSTNANVRRSSPTEVVVFFIDDLCAFIINWLPRVTSISLQFWSCAYLHRAVHSAVQLVQPAIPEGGHLVLHFQSRDSFFVSPVFRRARNLLDLYILSNVNYRW
jgi:hypothetical protein